MNRKNPNIPKSLKLKPWKKIVKFEKKFNVKSYCPCLKKTNSFNCACCFSQKVSIKNSKNFWNYFEIKSHSFVDFSFNTFNYLDGSLFLFLNLIVPFSTIYFLRLLSPAPLVGNTVYSLINLFCLTIGLLYFLIKSPHVFFSSGLFTFYMFQIGLKLLIIIFTPLISNLHLAPSFNYIVSMWVQIIFEILIICFSLFFVHNFKERIALTFKWRNLLKLFLVVFSSLMLLFLANVIFNKLALNQNSENQKALTNSIKAEENFQIRLLMLCTLAMLTIVCAPFVEELVFRQVWFTGVSQRTIAWISSAFIFGFIHVEAAGDLQNITTYLVVGFVLSTIFSLTRGNFVYSWLIHLGINVSAFIFLVMTL